ncbi:MAG: DUF4175 family protein [Polyangiaceae bacterium]
MVPTRMPKSLRALHEVWLFYVRAPKRRLGVAAFALVLTAALWLARLGTSSARIGAVCVVAAAGLLAALAAWRERRIARSPSLAIDRVSKRIDPSLSARAKRALSLQGQGKAQGVSEELARLHVDRALAALPVEAVRSGASRLAFVLGVVTLGVVVANLGACVRSPWAVVEGADVLLARRGVAPMGMTWLLDGSVNVRPPEYLHQEERRVAFRDDVALPRGALLTFRGAPAHAGRRLLLSDGTTEVPFVDDGRGQLVARWPLAGSVDLRVVARFGDVVVPEPEATRIESIPDAAPVVTLEDAPRRVQLATDDEPTEIPIHYEATDDHGLREVHLVLRSAQREERRVLARLDGETRVDRGGYVLRTSDAFVKRSHAPVEVRVEAKDNDPITGPKWGSSAAITLVPPDVGEPEARRLDAIRKLRDDLVDSLAWRLSNEPPKGDRRPFLGVLSRGVETDLARIEETLTGTFAGLRITGQRAAPIRAKARVLRDALKKETQAPSAASHAALVKASERLVLTVDSVVRSLGVTDTRAAAKELADVAEDAAQAAELALRSADRVKAESRVDADVSVLAGGGRAMRRLGALGRDLGEIVEAYLRRVDRARRGDDMAHAALAALDLAVRLRQPDPSFGASGGRPSHAGGESGGGRGMAGEGAGTGEEADGAFDEAVQELDKLAADHAGQIGQVEQSLSGGTSEEDVKALRDEAKKHAEAVREAAKPLPSVGGGSDSWTSKGAAAKEHAEQMARSLEQGNAADAVASGRNAIAAIDEARRVAARERFRRFMDTGPERTLEDARPKLERELRWAEQKLDELRRKAAQRAGPQMRAHGDAEGKLAERARELGQKGRRSETLPPASSEALDAAERAARDAARQLRDGNVERGLTHQRDAQQKLEEARRALVGEAEESEEGSRQDGDGRRPDRQHADIPSADAHKGPEEFRQRVLKGLGQPSSGRLKDAVKRYAEGLLR